MFYRIFLILILICMTGPDAYASERIYRVELLVFRHLQGVAESSPQTTLRGFSSALDLWPPAPAEALPDLPAGDVSPGAGAATAEQAGAAADLQPGEPAGAAAGEDENTGTGGENYAGTEQQPLTEELVPATMALDTPSDTMQTAWQRLKLSSAYRPELYLSWQQAGQHPYPLVRVHDLEVLIEEGPYADLRPIPAAGAAGQALAMADLAQDDVALLPAGGGQPIVAAPPGGEPADQGTQASGEDAAPPEPLRYYRLDGTARLSRRRFLHLDLDLEYREPTANIAETGNSPAVDAAQAHTGPEHSYLVYTLHQKRTVQTRRMEYFDGPVLAVLALISRIDSAPTPDAALDPAAE
jgi:hypothetical protein